MAQASVIGVVTQIQDDHDAKVLIIEETNGQYKNEVAVRFWGHKALPLIANVGVGQRVYVSGYIKARPGKDGSRYFTEFSGTQVLIEGDRQPVEDF